MFHSLEELGLTLLGAIAEYLGDRDGYLVSLVVGEDGRPDGTHMLRAIHYPAVEYDEPQTDSPTAFVIRGGEHRDLNLITLLPESTMSGLEILDKSNSWIPIRAQHGGILLNVGDMLALITSESATPLRAVLHRVTGDRGQAKCDRYSAPMFITPHLQRPLMRLTDGRAGEYVTAFETSLVQSGMFVWHRLRRSHPALKDTSYDEWIAGMQPFL
jgi:isopenicillin N synthase-like dioxygenase